MVAIKPITALEVINEQPVRVRAALLRGLEAAKLRPPPPAEPSMQDLVAVELDSADIDELRAAIEEAGVSLNLASMGVRIVATDVVR